MNAGNPDGDYTDQIDVDGELRVIDGRVDIGVDEWLDSDADGLPDWWEGFYFGDPTAADPNANEDGDGRNNLAEYNDGTNPLIGPRSYFVDTTGNDDWDGLSPEWDGAHGPKATIRAAMEATHPHEGDEVVIADGIYTGSENRNLNFSGKAITVRSADGDPRTCVIDCEDSGGGFSFGRGVSATSILTGLTIRNGCNQIFGVISCSDSSPTLNNLIIDTAYSYSSGIACSNSNPTLNNCIIRQNTLAGVYCASASHPTLNNCTIIDNGGEGISCYGESAPTLNNCILWNNYPQAIGDENENSVVNHCDVQGGWPGVGNIDVDPVLTSDGYLQAGSPCIDAGDNASVPADTFDLDGDGDTNEPLPIDLGGDPRFVDDIGMPDRGDAGQTGLPVVDMGAYEFQGRTCFGDFDGDNQVGLSDLARLLGHYGQTGVTYREGDLDADGDVDLGDLAELLGRYGDVCPQPVDFVHRPDGA